MIGPQKTGPSQISTIGHKDAEDAEHRRRAQAAQRGHRTRRLKAANKPFERLDAEAADVQRRVEVDELDRNVGRVLLQALALRKDLELAKDRRAEIVLKLEELDVRAELEELKRELGIS